MVQCPDRIIASIDTGVDDALALAYLLGSTDECELGGVIASYGNVDANTAYANTCAVLDLFGRADIPVFLGSEHPSWADAFIPDAGCAQFHGDDGLGNTRLAGSGALADGACVPGDDMSVDVPDEVVSVGGYLAGDVHAHPALGACSRVNRSQSVDHPQSAMPTALASGGKRRCSVDAADGIEYLIEQVREFGRDVTVLATGPLTDVDAAITRAPDIASKLRLVMMGGTLTQPGNCWDAVAETNIIQDPEAANRVFHSGADITMVGLDVTHQCLLPQSAADPGGVRRGPSAGGSWLISRTFPSRQIWKPTPHCSLAACRCMIRWRRRLHLILHWSIVLILRCARRPIPVISMEYEAGPPETRLGW